ncbi:hypothetical protein D3C75_1174390 [compost metagenome]
MFLHFLIRVNALGKLYVLLYKVKRVLEYDILLASIKLNGFFFRNYAKCEMFGIA